MHFLDRPVPALIYLPAYWFRWFPAMHGSVQIIGLYGSIDCRKPLLCHHHTGLRAHSCKRCIFHAHNHKSRQAKLSTHTQMQTPALAQRETGGFSVQPCSSLSNPSVVEKAPGQPFFWNPPVSKSSARPSVPISAPWKDSNTAHNLVSASSELIVGFFFALKSWFVSVRKK